VNEALLDINLYKKIFQLSAEGVLLVDKNGIILLSNLACNQLFNCDSEDFIDKNLSAFIVEEHNEALKNCLYKFTNKTSSSNLEVLAIKKNSTPFRLEIRCNATVVNGKEITIIYLRDINEHHNNLQEIKETNDKLLEINHKFNTLINNAKGILFRCENNRDYTMHYISEGCLEITGYSYESFKDGTITFGQLIVKEDQDMVWETIQNSIKLHTAYECEYRITHKNGTIKYVWVKGEFDFKKQSKTTFIEGFITDITARKEVELQLLDKEAKIKAILQAIPDMMFIQDQNGVYIEWFANTNDKLFVQPEDFIGVGMKDALPAHVYKKVKASHQRAKATGKIDITEYSEKIKDNLIHFEARAVPLSNDRMLNIVRDITEQKNFSKKMAEEKLKISQAQLKAYSKKLEKEVANRTSELTTTVQKLVAANLSLEDQIVQTQEAEQKAIANKSLSSTIANNFPNGLIIVFNRNFEILLLKGELLKEFEIDEKTIEGTTVDAITTLSEAQKTKLKQGIKKTVAGAHISFEIFYQNRHYSVNTAPLMDQEVNVYNALFIYNDISLQKESESIALNALKKEQELNELKSRFVAMASHEFRTPLSAIQTSTILIKKQNDAGNTQKLDKYISQIKRNVKNLDVILNDFLSLSKLEAGKVKLNKELLDVVAFSKGIIEEFSETKKMGQNIVLAISENVSLLQLDKKLLRHILMNLLSNAIKYSAENTTIYFNIEENNQSIMLIIKDEGIGIAKEEQDRLFERFYRTKNAQNIQGTGLGLHIAKQYIELLDGTIEVYSEINKGTTFLLKWPKPTTK